MVTNKDGSTWEAPPRPEGLRIHVLTLYGLIVLVFGFWVAAGLSLNSFSLKKLVPEGKFRKKDGTLIDIADFDPVELGPYPKCHSHFGEYEEVNESSGNKTWTKIKSAPSKGPFPPGHPENEAFKKKNDAERKKENYDNRYTWKGLQPCLHLLSLATLAVLVGSLHGVYIFTEKDEKTGPVGQEVLAAKDAYWFPILGSVVLFGLFVIYKYMNMDLVKFFITCYIITMCTVGFGTNLDQFMMILRKGRAKALFTIPVIEHEVTAIFLAGTFSAGTLGFLYITTKNWIINNIFGMSFSILGIKMIGTSTFKTGAIMLTGLFFYDIFWVFGSKSVFGSNVMVTVAKEIEAPIMLKFPRGVDGCGNFEHSMLGLGDIVVPGVFIAFLAKWDAVIQSAMLATSNVYLNVTMVAYVLSLITTVAIMLFFNAAQPALLYIVPYVLITSLVVALIRGELRELWRYEIPEKEDETKEGIEDKEEDKKDK